MPLTPRTFFHGYLPMVGAALYTVPENATALLKSMVIFAESYSPFELVIDGASSGYLARDELDVNETWVFDTPLVLAAGQSIIGAALHAHTLSILISGAEYTL